MTQKKTSLRKNQSPKPYEEPQVKQDSIKTVLFLVTFIGLVLTLLGYGYKLGLASRFGWYALDIVVDKTDFIYSSSIPLSLIFTKIFNSEWVLATILNNATSLLSIIIIPAFAFLVLRFAFSTSERRKKTRKLLESNVDSLLDKAIIQDGLFKGLLRIVTTVTVVASLFLATAYGLVISFIFLVIFVPTLGYLEGQKMAMDYIITPKSCTNHPKYIQAAIKNIKPSKNAAKSATCVRLVLNDKELVRGRVVAENKERIFLYVKQVTSNEQNKKVAVRVPKSYPKRNLIIEHVNTEEI